MIICLFLFCGVGHAAPQRDSLATITGVVRHQPGMAKDLGHYVGLGGCVVQLYFEKEGKLDSLYTTSSPQHGIFSFKNLKPQRVVLKVSCLGFETKSGVYDIEAGRNAFIFTLEEKIQELAAASVTAEIPLMKQIKDTTIFNTQAIQSLPDDGLKDVLAQLPGFSVGNSSIYVDGVKVSKTYVNGILVFGDDAMNAVNALKADEVTQVKVYDQQTELDKHRGKLNSRKERVLDVVTRENFVSLSQAGAALAGGLDGTLQGRYGAAGGVNYDSEMLNLEASVLASNYQNISDNTRLSGADASKSINPKERPLDSYQQDERVDLHLEKHWKSRTWGNNLIANYIYDHKSTRSNIINHTEFFEQGGQPHQFDSDTTSSNSSVHNHRLSLRTNLMDTPLKTIWASLSSSVSHGNSGSNVRSLKQSDGFETMRRDESIGSKDLSYDLSGMLHWENNDAVKWRPEFGMTADISNNTSASWTVDTLATSFLKRQLKSDGLGRNYNGGVRFGLSGSLINTKARTLDINFQGSVSYSNRKSRKLSVDEWDVVIPVTDLANSYDFTYNEVLSNAQVGIVYSDSKKLNIIADLSLNDKVMLNDERLPQDFLTRRNFVYPSYSFNLSMPKFELRSSSQAITPSTEQIRNRISDSNPMVLTGGNPQLRQSHQLSLAGTYRTGSISGHKGRTHNITAQVTAGSVLAPMVGRTYFFANDTQLDRWDGYVARAGSMLNTWENSSRPSWNAGATVNYDTRIFKNRVGLKTSLSSSYAQNPMYLGENLVWMDNWSGSVSLYLNYSPSRKFTINDRISTSYAQSTGKTAGAKSMRVSVRNRFHFKWYILHPRVWWETTYEITTHNYLGGSGRDNFSHVLNTRIAGFVTKKFPLQLSISGNDLLNSGSVYSMNIDALSMSQTWQPTYGRYFLITVEYRFRKKR